MVTRDLLVSASLVCWFWGLNSGLGTCEIRTLIAVEPPAIDRLKNMKYKRHGPPHKPPVNPISLLSAEKLVTMEIIITSGSPLLPLSQGTVTHPCPVGWDLNYL